MEPATEILFHRFCFRKTFWPSRNLQFWPMEALFQRDSLPIGRFLRRDRHALFCFLPQLSMNIRRLRDFGKNWKWIFINFVPVIGWIIWFIWIGLGKTGKGLNKFI